MDGFKTAIGTSVVSCGAPGMTPARCGLARWQIRALTVHIDLHLDGGYIAVEDLAALARLSVSRFGRAFKQSFGRSPHAHIIATRLERARGLMIGTREPLAQIAAAEGLSDQSHLSRLFRKYVGESPLAWRRARWTPLGAGIVLQ